METIYRYYKFRPIHQGFEDLCKSYDKNGSRYVKNYLYKCINVSHNYNCYYNAWTKSRTGTSHENYKIVKQLLQTKEESNVIMAMELLRKTMFE